MFAENRRIHCSLDKLPDDLTRAVISMATDNAWPADFEGEKLGKPRYKDMADYVCQKGFTVNVYAIGRFCRRLGTLRRMKEAGAIVRDVMDNLSNEKASATQKGAAEMITAVVIEFLMNNEQLDAKEIKNVATATKDCAWVALAADRYVREQMQKKVQAVKNDVAKIGGRKVIHPDTLRAIREQVYGIVDKHLGFKKPIVETDLNSD